MPLAKDLLHPSIEEEKGKCKLKRLVQSPNSYFMDVKCPGCYKITTVFSHAQTVVVCAGCSTVLCQPTGGKARLTEGCSFRRKQHWCGGEWRPEHRGKIQNRHREFSFGHEFLEKKTSRRRDRVSSQSRRLGTKNDARTRIFSRIALTYAFRLYIWVYSNSWLFQISASRFKGVILVCANMQLSTESFHNAERKRLWIIKEYWRF